MKTFTFRTTRHTLGYATFLVSCGIFAASFVVGAVYRFTLARHDPVLVHFSNLGNAFAARGDATAAIQSYKEILMIRPVYPEIEFNLGNTLAAKGEIHEAVQHFEQALRLRPSFADAHYNLANLLAGQKQFEAADQHYQWATSLRADYADAHHNWGVMLARWGQPERAIQELRQALRLRPDDRESHFHLGLVLSVTRRHAEAIQVLRRGLEIAPDHLDMMDALAWILATTSQQENRNGAEAVRLAERVCAASGDQNGQHLDTLAASYAATGRYEQAVRFAEQARKLAAASGNTVLENAVAARLSLYQAHRPYNE